MCAPELDFGDCCFPHFQTCPLLILPEEKGFDQGYKRNRPDNECGAVSSVVNNNLPKGGEQVYGLLVGGCLAFRSRRFPRFFPRREGSQTLPSFLIFRLIPQNARPVK